MAGLVCGGTVAIAGAWDRSRRTLEQYDPALSYLRIAGELIRLANNSLSQIGCRGATKRPGSRQRAGYDFEVHCSIAGGRRGNMLIVETEG
jgi:hypothetical protein